MFPSLAPEILEDEVIPNGCRIMAIAEVVVNGRKIFHSSTGQTVEELSL